MSEPIAEKNNHEKKNVLGSMVKPQSDCKDEASGKDEAKKEAKSNESGKDGEKKSGEASRKKKEPTGKVEEKVIHTVTFDLTEEEFAGKGKQAAALQGDLDKLERQFQGVKEEHKANSSLLEMECNHVLSVIRRGKEEREVECVKLIDFDRGIVEFWFKGKIVEQRGVKPEEKQTKLF